MPSSLSRPKNFDFDFCVLKTSDCIVGEENLRTMEVVYLNSAPNRYLSSKKSASKGGGGGVKKKSAKN